MLQYEKCMRVYGTNTCTDTGWRDGRHLPDKTSIIQQTLPLTPYTVPVPPAAFR